MPRGPIDPSKRQVGAVFVTAEIVDRAELVRRRDVVPADRDPVGLVGPSWPRDAVPAGNNGALSEGECVPVSAMVCEPAESVLYLRMGRMWCSVSVVSSWA